ncbi:hypothetical protein [Parapedobacter sp. 10938]|uniref:hypothetical protein n=1 Tax=Parapedobacter flavus TaxID=3110225 RepID=UPI002DB77FF4|nr:hypothetical protein [Parapedobacter sp. 10938]MEC3881223.1 hypothetical protein [Parapedobacter sp. 10938]
MKRFTTRDMLLRLMMIGLVSFFTYGITFTAAKYGLFSVICAGYLIQLIVHREACGAAGCGDCI